MQFLENQIYGHLKEQGVEMERDKIKKFLVELQTVEQASTPEQEEFFIKAMVMKWYQFGKTCFSVQSKAKLGYIAYS